MPSSPTPVQDGCERDELLGSLTTLQQQRTSARVIKKLRLDDAAADREKKEIPECETQKLKDEEKETHKLTVKQRMPKALWSADEKNLFFEALNEYGKDFDSITAHICTKMKKKGVTDANLKTKNQVSHFYYRTWHKLSKHVHFDENVKKVAQELYALINYGELRKKLSSVSEKTCARLGEMVCAGSLVVRVRGRNVRLRTPMCRALRRLNQITEYSTSGRVCGRCVVYLRARCASSWARVQAAAHNPRLAAAVPLRTELVRLIEALQTRWSARKSSERKQLLLESQIPDEADVPVGNRTPDGPVDLESHLNLETDNMIVQERKSTKKLALHVGPPPSTAVHIPVLTASEQLSSQKICFSSYLERIKGKPQPKIRTPKRQRKDSAEKDQVDKKIKMEDEAKLMDIDETAVDGIELMATYKTNVEENISDDDKEKDGGERDRYMCEREKDVFSEAEDDENCISHMKSDTDNESDGKDKPEDETKFKKLKVKFRIRPKKRGGSIYTLISDKDRSPERAKVDPDIKNENPKQKEDQTKGNEDQIKGAEEVTKAIEDKIEECKDDIVKVPKETRSFDDNKPEEDVDFMMRQIRKGWSVHDAGHLTIGDLYLMFGSRSTLQLDYWWAEPTPPIIKTKPANSELEKTPPTDRVSEKEKLHLEKKEKADKTPEKGTEYQEDEKRERESETDIVSPKNVFNQDSNDGLSGDERKGEQLTTGDLKTSSCTGTLRFSSKLVNRPIATTDAKEKLSIVTDRLKRLLALAGNPSILSQPAKCNCSHVCPTHKKKTPLVCTYEKPQLADDEDVNYEDPDAQIFRLPTPIAPKDQSDLNRQLNTDDLPRYRRGRPRGNRQVVVQRLLPLLPKLPPNNLIPVKMVSNQPPQLPKLLPKPTVNDSQVYVVSQQNGRYYFHDGDNKFLITPPNEDSKLTDAKDSNKAEDSPIPDVVVSEANKDVTTPLRVNTEHKNNATDLTSFLPSESMSLSPSRLLRDSEGAWLEGSVQDFSLSSFLGHLEGRTQPDLAVDAHLQSLLAENSIDYVAKFADLAAEVTAENPPSQDDVNMK